jgi:hypothetical protein
MPGKPDSVGVDLIAPPFVVRQRASDAAYVLRHDYSDRLTIDQRIRKEVIGRVAPERLGWREIGDALATYAQVVEVRV